MQARCPHCQAALDATPAQAGSTVTCPACRGSFTIPSAAEQIRATGPAVPTPPTQAITNADVSIPVPGGPGGRGTAFLTQSPTLRREMGRFADDRLPDLTPFAPEPLPADVPDEADELGEPLASVRLRGDSRLGPILGSTIFLGISAFYTLLGAAQITLAHPQQGHEGVGPLVGGLVLGALGVYLWRGRRRVLPARALWVCPGGLSWEFGRHYGCCTWDQVENFAVSGATGRALVWITPREGINFVLSAGQGPAVGPLTEYIELKCSAALLPVALRRLVDGDTLRFGQLVMDRGSIRWRHEERPWPAVTDLAVAGDVTRVETRSGQRGFRLRTRDVSFPMVAQAITRIVTEEGLPA